MCCVKVSLNPFLNVDNFCLKTQNTEGLFYKTNGIVQICERRAMYLGIGFGKLYGMFVLVFRKCACELGSIK
jgi:hypothetical protein